MSVPAVLAAPAASGAWVLTQEPGGGDSGGQGADFGKSSPVGLLLLLLFLVSLVFLLRSMSRHLKRLPGSFEASEETPDDEQHQTDGVPEVDERQNGEAETTSDEQPERASPAPGD